MTSLCRNYDFCQINHGKPLGCWPLCARCSKKTSGFLIRPAGIGDCLFGIYRRAPSETRSFQEPGSERVVIRADDNTAGTG